ncbi:hypothetical protein PAAG_12299 [Paracoccidioides lutzii Pb01]|uniref:Uncharacterized protein n=1 Tax=Paracoccidioides lutzii (strain ATCC MYA-826 / Pb01) TaxID=502779 RepID=A0A0A2V3N8_PARBA|nr:hypothetical protein PAAG_12299 [Paracoccidioides lutzii Pb01]KGQ00992.1 hypothetical protein PAAG_12299 [Paracoccidioides lutzii Pb01]
MALALQIPVPLLLNEHPQSVSLDLKVKNIVDFFRRNWKNDHRIRMESVFSGNSPPYNEFGFAAPELNAKIEFSQDLEFNHLVDFLQRYQNDDRTIRMEFPFSGNPLPFMNSNSNSGRPLG